MMAAGQIVINCSAALVQCAVFISCYDGTLGGSVSEWLACWTQMQKGPGSNRSCDAVG